MTRPDGASERGLLPDSLSDRGNAKLFVALHGRTCRYVPGLGWYRWSGYRWESDGDDAVLWAAGEMAEAFATTDPHGRYTASARWSATGVARCRPRECTPC
ncbi:hypothetical protein ACFXDD_35900 [Streptomyces anthocyanicus]